MTIAHPIFTCTRLGTRITGRPSPVTGESCPGNCRSQPSTLQLGVDDDVDVPPCLWEGTYVGSLVPRLHLPVPRCRPARGTGALHLLSRICMCAAISFLQTARNQGHSIIQQGVTVACVMAGNSDASTSKGALILTTGDRKSIRCSSG